MEGLICRKMSRLKLAAVAVPVLVLLVACGDGDAGPSRTDVQERVGADSRSEVTVVFGQINLSLQARPLFLLLLPMSPSVGQTWCDAAPTPTLATVARDAESPETRPAPIPTLTPNSRCRTLAVLS